MQTAYAIVQKLVVLILKEHCINLIMFRSVSLVDFFKNFTKKNMSNNETVF